VNVILKGIKVCIKSNEDYNIELRNLHLSLITKREGKDLAIDFGIENFFIQE
jgi:hypothetical protein